jgi:exonuclease III
MELEDLDVLCIQESWMAAGAPVPAMPGYKVVEQRRTQGAHGGLATYYRQSLQLENT